MDTDIVKERFIDSIGVKQKIVEDKVIQEKIVAVADIVVKALKSGKKLVIGGNGGSEADSLHFAGEIVGRFQRERDPWPAIVLGSDQISLTAIANDYSYRDAYAREARAYCAKDDVLFGISTSGNSENILYAVRVAKEKGCKTILLAGKDGGQIAKEADISIIVPSNVTARIQESHITIIHIICELVEEAMSSHSY
jgi:D-sedoheptulose 7-phosphate isomerase